MRGHKVPSLFRLNANNSNDKNIYIHLFTTCTNILAAYISMFVHANERVTGRKARVLQIRKEAADIFISLKWQEETNQGYVFPSLYKFKRKFLLTCCVAKTPGFT